MKWLEHYELLLRKAAQDEYLLDLMIGDQRAPAEIFGFHAQQAAEKALTPFAVEFRYDALPEEPEAPLDKQATRVLIRRLRGWAESLRDASLP